MWDFPGPGLEPVSPALAGGFLTTVPPAKSLNGTLKDKACNHFVQIKGVFLSWICGLIIINSCPESVRHGGKKDIHEQEILLQSQNHPLKIHDYLPSSRSSVVDCFLTFSRAVMPRFGDFTEITFF